MDPTSFLFIVVAFVAVFWFMSRGQKKQQQRAQDRLAQLEPGSWVMTTAGFYGRLIDIDGDVAILETADGTETYWLRAAIRGAQEPPFGTSTQDEASDQDSVQSDDEESTVEDKNLADDVHSLADIEKNEHTVIEEENRPQTEK